MEELIEGVSLSNTTQVSKQKGENFIVEGEDDRMTIISSEKSKKCEIMRHYKNLRHISVKKLLHCICLSASFIKTHQANPLPLFKNEENTVGQTDSLNVQESKMLIVANETAFKDNQIAKKNLQKKILRQIDINTPKFKNYFNGKQCIRQFTHQTLKNMSKVKEWFVS